MKIINQTIYSKLILQADEARDQGLEKLANGVLSAMPPSPREPKEKITYSSEELEENIYQKLWKIAMDVITYHDVQSVDIQKIDNIVSDLSTQILQEVQASISVDNTIGPLEPELLGESK